MLLSFNAGIQNLKNKTAACQALPDRYGRYSNLSPLKYDTVSFGAMKKTAFNGIDLLVVNKFKAPIEKFYTNDNLQNWCKTKLDNEYLNKDYKGRQLETVEQRKHMLKEWFDYCLKENDAYNNAVSLLIIDGITSELKVDNDNLPPVLNKGVLADTITQMQASNEKEVNFNKLYQINLKKSLTADLENRNGDYTGWVIIPSKENDSMHFEENVSKLKTLSHKNWCTKSFNAEPYLSEGDFHIYMEKGEPKLGVRFEGDIIQEIQGERNNSRIPIQYFDTAIEHTASSKINEKTAQELKQAEEIKREFAEFEKRLGKPAAEASVKELLTAAGKPFDENGNLLFNADCKNPADILKWEDLGIDTENFFQEVKKMKINTFYTNLGKPAQEASTEEILNAAEIKTRIKNGIFETEYIKSPSLDADWDDLGIDINTLMKGIRELKIKAFNDYLGEPAENAPVEKLLQAAGIECETDEKDGLLIISEYRQPSLGLSWTDIGIDENKFFEKIKKIKGDANFKERPITSLGNVEEIGGGCCMSFSGITSLGKLRKIEGCADFRYSKFSSFENLIEIDGGCFIYGSCITPEMCIAKGFNAVP